MLEQKIFHNIEDAIEFVKNGDELGYIVYFYIDSPNNCLNILDME